MRKPTTADGYPPGLAAEARRMCLYIATILGDLLDEIVVVGGLVPYLIIDQRAVPEAHVGTRDLDLGLTLAVLDDARYREISVRLRDRGFTPAKNEHGRITRQTWTLSQERVTIDFLIPPSPGGPAPSKLQNLEADFAAIVTPALPLAFRDCMEVEIDDRTPVGAKAKRTVRVCGPAAFVAMKAHALRSRGGNKDAYDLVYVLRHFGDGKVTEVAGHFEGIADDDEARQAIDILRDDFASPEHLGPVAAADFLGSRDPARQADAFGYVQEFLRLVGSP